MGKRPVQDGLRVYGSFLVYPKYHKHYANRKSSYFITLLHGGFFYVFMFDLVCVFHMLITITKFVKTKSLYKL
jgi:hypothetical protein